MKRRRHSLKKTATDSSGRINRGKKISPPLYQKKEMKERRKRTAIKKTNTIDEEKESRSCDLHIKKKNVHCSILARKRASSGINGGVGSAERGG